ncbi:MAG: FKBP-type peptidyl-prolyl cis-trans isomerase [Coriobacteriia bacterium]|nr:FKBP-type peptidyl-prolyl cis-trans isomerase [Coriobacteriia bacterium]
MKKLLLGMLMAMCVFALIGCAGGAADADVPDDTTQIFNMPEGQVSELQIEDIVVGDGEEAVDGKTLEVHYTGTLVDGTEFDSSVGRAPFTFVLGAGRVIEGWDVGLVGMKVGGVRQLTIPAHMAYGDSGSGNVIPPGATLIFEVELLDVQ